MTSQLNEQSIFDLVVIGGGINGAGIARDAAGRGLKVLLCEKDDFGQHTSSASTKLIHGGLRYLENYDFKLVRHSLREREVLLRNAPHIIWPLRFVLPHGASSRPRWMIRTGLFLYDFMSPLTMLTKSRQIQLSRHESGFAINSSLKYGFEYSDCWVQDSRLVVLNVMDAEALGACVLSRTRCTKLERENDHWWVTLAPDGNLSMLKEPRRVRSRVVINAAGAWVNDFARQIDSIESEQHVNLVRGSHIVVKKLYDHEYAYIFQNRDRRILFCIPYEKNFTLIGTTEVVADNPDNAATISKSEIDYLCEGVNRYLNTSVHPQDVVWNYSGVRVLYDDPNRETRKMSRDYTLKLDSTQAPIVTIFGGKITTYRILAEDVLDLISNVDGFAKPKWTRDSNLPGGDIEGFDVAIFAGRLEEQYKWLPVELVERYARHYGSRVFDILKDCHSISDLGIEFSPELYQVEVDYLVEREYARSAADVIWRRTRQGLRMNASQVNHLDTYINSIFNPEESKAVTANANVYC